MYIVHHVDKTFKYRTTIDLGLRSKHLPLVLFSWAAGLGLIINHITRLDIYLLILVKLRNILNLHQYAVRYLYNNSKLYPPKNRLRKSRAVDS